MSWWLNSLLCPCSQVLVVYSVHSADAAVLHLFWPLRDSGRPQPTGLQCELYHNVCLLEPLQRRTHHASTDAGAPLLNFAFGSPQLHVECLALQMRRVIHG